MPTPPRIYGDQRRFKAALGRHVSSGYDLLDRLDGVRGLIASTPGGPGTLGAYIHEQEWTEEVERWRRNVWRALRRHLADGAPAALPVATAEWPPDTGKPRHARRIGWVEPWLRDALNELVGLRDAFGVRRDIAAAPPPAPFGELGASGLVDSRVIEGHAKDMREPRTPKQLADAIGAAKELTEATLRGALDRLGEPWTRNDDLQTLMKKWRRRVEDPAPPDVAGREALDRVQGALGNLVTFLATWRNTYGSGHGRPRYPPGLKPRHARLAADTSEMAVRFIATTMDDLELLPPE